MRVFKYPIHNSMEYIELPKNHKILSFQKQHMTATIWCEVDETDTETRLFEVHRVLTGGQVPVDYDIFLGTIQFNDGFFVVHYYLIEVKQ